LLILGKILSIPLCALFMFLIFKKNDNHQGTGTVHVATPNLASNIEHDDILQQIQKLSELKDSGVLTEEEFLQKKEQLISEI